METVIENMEENKRQRLHEKLWVTNISKGLAKTSTMQKYDRRYEERKHFPNKVTFM